MWRSLLLGAISIPLSFVAFLIGWSAGSFKTGLISGLCVFVLFFLAAIVVLLFTRRISPVDVFLPIPIAVLWSVILIPFSLGTEVFTAPSCIGSAILLSMSLWMIRKGDLPNAWAVIPATVFAYEMLPINIPGPFDDWFAFGGDAVYLLVQGILLANGVRTLGPGSSNDRSLDP